MLTPARCFQYATPVVKYDRNGFKARERLLVLTQSSAYVVEMAKIKQKIDYATLKGNGVNWCGAFLPISDPAVGERQASESSTDFFFLGFRGLEVSSGLRRGRGTVL